MSYSQNTHIKIQNTSSYPVIDKKLQTQLITIIKADISKNKTTDTVLTYTIKHFVYKLKMSAQ